MSVSRQPKIHHSWHNHENRPQSGNWLIIWRWKRYVPSKPREEIAQPHGAATQKNCFLNTQTGLELIKYFSAASFSADSAPSLPHDLTYWKPVVFSLSPSPQAKRAMTKLSTPLLVAEGWSFVKTTRCWEPHCHLFLCLTHTHTYTFQAARYGRKFLSKCAIQIVRNTNERFLVIFAFFSSFLIWKGSHSFHFSSMTAKH